MGKKELLLSGIDHKLVLKKITNAQDFKELKEKWNSLLEQSSNPNIFLTWEWLYTWWEFYSSEYELYTLLVFDQNDNLLGIAPLCLTFLSPLKLKTLNFLGTEEVCSDHLDFILKKGMEGNLLPLFFKHLEENPKEWDLLDLTDLREDSYILPFIRNWAKEKIYKSSASPWTICPYASLPESWELFLNKLSSNARKDIRRQLRLFAESKEFIYNEVQDKKELIPSMEKLFYLHTKRWTALGKEGVFQRERFNRFHEKISEIFLDKGWLLLSFISSPDRNIGIHYNFIFANKIYSYQSGFDPEWESFSPGTVSLALIIKHAISQGFKEFDFLRGDAPYKYKWTDKERVNLQLRVWNKNLKSDFFRNGLLLIDRSKKLTKKYLPGFAVKILKSLWLGLKGDENN